MVTPSKAESADSGPRRHDPPSAVSGLSSASSGLHSFLGQTVTVVVDRPSGSRHPEWGFAYPVNYGYLPGTMAADGEPIDAYVLGVDRPLTHFTGRCTAVIERADDVEDKLVVVPPGQQYTAGEIMTAVAFQEQFFQTTTICEEQADGFARTRGA
jgi:inorganic pyrophosphatase